MLNNRFQQVVVVVGLGLGLWFVGDYITGLGIHAVGWTGYAPLTTAPVADLTTAEQLLVWLGLIAAWVSLSTVIVRDQRKPTGE